VSNEVTYSLYNTVTGKTLKWGDPETGKSLFDAYKATIAYCKAQENPAEKMASLEIYELVDNIPVQSFSVEGAYDILIQAQNELEQEEAVEEEEVPDQMIPSSSMGPWYIDLNFHIDNAIPIRDHDNVLVAMVVDNEDTRESLEQNARLITKAPELMLLASRMLSSIHDKEEGIRTEDEQSFLEGMYILYGGHEIRTEIDILDKNSRDILLNFVDNTTELYNELASWIQHGKQPTEEMKGSMYRLLEDAIDSQNRVKTHLL
jgi:hypothetical protein